MAYSRLLVFISFGSAFLWSPVQAQQLPLFTQYREYHSVLNPATVNSDYILNRYNLSFGASLRTQWVGVARNPQTQILRGEYCFNKNNDNFFTPIVGGYLMNDATGPTGFRGIYGRFAMIGTHDPREGGFSAGLNIGATQFHLNATEVYFRQPDQLAQQDYQQMYPDIGLGVFGYKTFSGEKDILYGGLSVPQIFGFDLRFKGTDKEFAVKRVPHFYGLLGFYKFLPFAEGTFVEPSVWIKYVPNVAVQLDFNTRYQMGEYIWLGVGYSTANTFHGEIGFLLGENIGWANNNCKIGYGYDHAFSTISPYFGTTHEINFTFTIDKK
jgi:type IX secretion system PorP/SprF family membrane protein